MHPGIDLPVAAQQLEFQPQLEVPKLLLRGEEFVVRDFLRERAADERAVRNPPRLRGVTLPSVEGLAIRKRDGRGVGEGGEGEGEEERELHSAHL